MIANIPPLSSSGFCNLKISCNFSLVVFSFSNFSDSLVSNSFSSIIPSASLSWNKVVRYTASKEEFPELPFEESESESIYYY